MALVACMVWTICALIGRMPRPLSAAIAVAAAFFVVVVCGGAIAQTATPAPTQVTVGLGGPPALVDFSGFVILVIQLMAAFLVAAATIASRWVISLLAKKAEAAGYHVDEQLQEKWSTNLFNGLYYAIEHTEGVTAAMVTAGNLNVDVKSQLLVNAIKYLELHVPDLLKAKGVMNANGSIDTLAVSRAIEARMGHLQSEQASTPAPAAPVVIAAPVAT
jgi:hypothetical protein